MNEIEEMQLVVCQDGHVHMGTRACTMHLSIAQFLAFAKKAQEVAHHIEHHQQPTWRVIDGGKSKRPES